MSDKPFSLQDDVTEAFTKAGLLVLKYERVRPDWIRLTVDGGNLPKYKVGVNAVGACSLAIDVRDVTPLGNSRYEIHLEVDDRTTIQGIQATKFL